MSDDFFLTWANCIYIVTLHFPRFPFFFSFSWSHSCLFSLPQAAGCFWYLFCSFPAFYIFHQFSASQRNNVFGNMILPSYFRPSPHFSFLWSPPGHLNVDFIPSLFMYGMEHLIRCDSSKISLRSIVSHLTMRVAFFLAPEKLELILVLYEEYYARLRGKFYSLG